MVAQVLYSMEGAPAGGTSTFTDVAAGTWYASAVNWAAANGVVSGYGDRDLWPQRQRYPGTSGDDPVQLAKSKDTMCPRGQPVFLCRHVQCQHLCTGGYELGCRAGLISGMGNNTIVPQGSATRLSLQLC